MRTSLAQPEEPALRDNHAGQATQLPVGVRTRAWIVPLIASAVVLAAYANSLWGVFVFDDDAITNEPAIRRLWPPSTVLAVDPKSALGGRPVVAYSFALNYAIGGLKPWGYHAVNLVLHLVAAWTLFGIVRRSLLTQRLADGFGSRAGSLGLATALLWAVHPLLTDSVTYTVQRTELLMGLCFFLTLYCLIRSHGSTHPRYWSTAGVISCWLGAGSKEVIAVAPSVLLAYDALFLTSSPWQALRRRPWFYVGLALCWPVLVWLVCLTNRREVVGFALPGLAPWQYWLTQTQVLMHYLWLSLWPARLVIDYHDWPIAKQAADAWPGLLLIGLLIAVGAWLWRQRHPLAFAWCWFLLILAPTSLVPMKSEIAAERRMYLPLAAITTLAVIGTDGLLRATIRSSSLRRRLGCGLLAGCVGALAIATVRRNQDYQSQLRIWTDAVEKRPRNPRARLDLGLAYSTAGHIGEAAAQYAEAIRLEPDYAEAYSNLGSALTKQGRLQEALRHLEKALRLKPDLEEAHFNRGVVLARQGRLVDAIAAYEQALMLNPHYGQALNNLGTALSQRGEFARAAEQYLLALREHPEIAELYYNLGTVLAKQGNVQAAILAYGEALRLRPDFAQAHYGLAEVLATQGQATRSRPLGNGTP